MPDTKNVSVLTADIKATKAADGSYDITLSIPELDRDDEIVDAKALEWTTSGRMPIDVDHGMTVLTTVGSGIPVYEGDDLKLSDFRFASTPFAQDVKTLVDEEHVSKMSVAFMAAKREKDEKDGKVHIRKGELLNAAIVAIPSNREANILVGKALAGIESRKTEAKAVAGSYEERAEHLREALAVANPGAEWLWVRATFDESVVYAIETPSGYVSYQATYEITADGITFGEPEEVDLAEVVVPAKSVKSTTETDPDEEPAPAASRPADVDVAKARRDLLAAEAALALHP